MQRLGDIGRAIEQLETEVGAVQKQQPQAVHLSKVPGIGVVGATALAATLGGATPICARC